MYKKIKLILNILSAFIIFIYYLFTKYDVNEIINKLSTFMKKIKIHAKTLLQNRVHIIIIKQ